MMYNKKSQAYYKTNIKERKQTSNGMKASSRLFDVYLRSINLDTKQNNITKPRITVSKKVSSKATERNRFKRQIREILRAFLTSNKDMKNIFNIAIVVKKEALAQKFNVLSKDLTDLLNYLSNPAKFKVK